MFAEWSQTATVVPKQKPNPPNTFPFMASVRSIKSNSTQSSTVSSESSQRQVTISRPDLGKMLPIWYIVNATMFKSFTFSYLNFSCGRISIWKQFGNTKSQDRTVVSSSWCTSCHSKWAWVSFKAMEEWIWHRYLSQINVTVCCSVLKHMFL